MLKFFAKKAAQKIIEKKIIPKTDEIMRQVRENNKRSSQSNENGDPDIPLAYQRKVVTEMLVDNI